MPRARKGMFQRPDDQAAHEIGVAKPHLGLSGMDINVNQGRVEVEIEGGGGVAIPRQKVRIGRAQGPLQQTVPHRTAIDEQILMGRIAARIGRQAAIARQTYTLAFLIKQQGIGLELWPQDRGQPCQAPLVALVLGSQSQGPASVQIEAEGRILMRHGLALDLVGNGHGFGPLGLHELQTSRCGIEKVPHLHPRTVRAGKGGRLNRPHRAALNAQRIGIARAPRP